MTDGRPLPAEVVERIVGQTDGVPLFVEELTKTVLESDLVADRGDRYELIAPLSGLAIPESLHASLTARLDRLGPPRRWRRSRRRSGASSRMSCSPRSPAAGGRAARGALAQLVETELVFRAASRRMRATFKHALVQETAYRAVLRERREELHARIARTLAADFPEVLENHPELIAHHCTEAGLDEEAVEFWREAGGAGDGALGGQGGGRSSHERAAGAGQVPGGSASQPHRGRPADQPRRGVDRGADFAPRKPGRPTSAPGSSAERWAMDRSRCRRCSAAGSIWSPAPSSSNAWQWRATCWTWPRRATMRG